MLLPPGSTDPAADERTLMRIRLGIDISFRYFATMRNENDASDTLNVLKALASPVRLAILADLRNPATNFPPQVDGDPIKDGICADFIRERLDIAAATASRHLTILCDAQLLIATRKKGWTFYRRDEDAIGRFVRQLGARL